MRKFLIIALLISIFLPLIFIDQTKKFSDQKLHIIACDVGQGDAIFIRTPNAYDVLIDGGPSDRVLSCLSSHMPFWDRTIDMVILTNPDKDHYEGLKPIIRNYDVKNFYASTFQKDDPNFKELVDLLAVKNQSAKFLAKGDIFRFPDGVTIEIFWPRLRESHLVDNNGSKTININETSVIFKLSFGKFDALFTGDAGVVSIEDIDQDIGDVELLKVPHHGSKTGLSAEILKNITPEYAFISSGKNNRYGHPAANILGLLDNASVRIFRTDINGEIVLKTDGKLWEIINE